MNNTIPNKNKDLSIFDRTNRQQKIKRCHPRFENHDFLFKWVENQILDRLLDIKHTFPKSIIFDSRHDYKLLKECNKINDLYIASPSRANIIADEEYLPLKDQTLDLLIHPLNLHATNDLPGTLIQARRALKPDGLFLAAMFGGETLYELRESLTQAELKTMGGISPRIFPFADKQQMGALMQRAGFALPVIDSDIITVTYDNTIKLMHDLRGMGESNIITARHKKNPGKAFFKAVEDHYQTHFKEPDGRLHASFEIIFLLGWAPHDSQQKPLKPGSAQNRLADALKTTEIPSGEKP